MVYGFRTKLWIPGCVQDQATIGPLQSQVTLLVRASYSNPPAHGARIVNTVLQDPALYQEHFYNMLISRSIQC